MYRWAVERDTWVSAGEIAEARAFLQAIGIATTELPDGRFALAGAESAVEASRLILVSLRHLYERRSRPQSYGRTAGLRTLAMRCAQPDTTTF